MSNRQRSALKEMWGREEGRGVGGDGRDGF